LLEAIGLAGIRKNSSQPPEPGAAAGEHDTPVAGRPEATDAGPRRVKSGPNALILAPVFVVEAAWLLLLVYLGWRLLSQL
jgi:hypothetical protein